MNLSQTSVSQIADVTSKGREPLRQFLERHARERDRQVFWDLSRQLAARNGANADEIQPTDFRVLMPSFVTSQVTEAFRIGFLLFIPFLVIDLVIANILQSLGMFMLSPTQVSLPFKLLLFILVDGWHLLLKNLVLGYI